MSTMAPPTAAGQNHVGRLRLPGTGATPDPVPADVLSAWRSLQPEAPAALAAFRRAWDEERARKTFIAILDLIEQPKAKVAEGQIPPDDPVVATYRRRLSSVVLS